MAYATNTNEESFGTIAGSTAVTISHAVLGWDLHSVVT